GLGVEDTRHTTAKTVAHNTARSARQDLVKAVLYTTFAGSEPIGRALPRCDPRPAKTRRRATSQKPGRNAARNLPGETRGLVVFRIVPVKRPRSEEHTSELQS